MALVADVQPAVGLDSCDVVLALEASKAEKLPCGKPKNGWRFWWVQRPDGRRRLEAVRDELFTANSV